MPEATGLFERSGVARLHRDQAERAYVAATRCWARFAGRVPGGEPSLDACVRAVQRCVDLAGEAPAALAALASVRGLALAPGAAPVPTHAVNVMLLAILLGAEVGLGRADQAAVGLAALLHDAGGAATDDPRLGAIDNVRRLLRLGAVETTARALLVTLDGAGESAERDLASRIVAVADACDQLAAGGSRPVDPAGVVAALESDPVGRSEPRLAACLARTLAAPVQASSPAAEELRG